MGRATSFDYRNNPMFLRNQFEVTGKWELAVVRKQEIDFTDLGFIGYSSTKRNEVPENRRKAVLFFEDDNRFNGVYERPFNYVDKLSQYSVLCTPDFSMYQEMNLWRQLESVARNRWCGAYWQSLGLKVITTISWSSPSSYSFCFDGVEKNSVVAIGMIGCKSNNKRAFLNGYNAMLERIAPSAIVCYGVPFAEMIGNLIVVDYFTKTRQGVR